MSRLNGVNCFFQTLDPTLRFYIVDAFLNDVLNRVYQILLISTPLAHRDYY